MRCAICNGRADWDSSFGYNEFIVCYSCYNKLAPSDTDDENTLNFIFACGQIRRDRKKREGNKK